MANKPPTSPEANTRPGAAPSPVIVRRPLATSGSGGGQFKVLMIALVVSCLVHFVVLPIFLLFNFSQGEEQAKVGPAVIETKVQEDTKPADQLENDEVGIDPTIPETNYNVDRIEPISIPGVVNKEESVGIPGGTDETPMTVPPPPGFGGAGTGAAIESSVPGIANPNGVAGGMGGPLMKPGGFGGRSAATRKQMITQGGGNEASEAAVGAGQLWIHCHQAPDGHWSLDNFDRYTRILLDREKWTFSDYRNMPSTGHGQHKDIAGTAFGLLPLLGAGQTHRGTGKYSGDVEKGLKYLILHEKADGDFGEGMYSQGLATIAMCEAYGLTSDPVLKLPAQRAVNFIAKAQSGAGGWSYTAPCVGHDTSVGGWQLMALKSGMLAGLDVPPKTMNGCTSWLNDVSGPDGSTYGYQGPPSPNDPKIAMNAVGLLCRMYLGWGKRNPGLQKGIDVLKKNPPTGEGTTNNMYYYYYATQVFHHMGGDAWDFWNPKMRDRLVTSQDQGKDRNHSSDKGSWSPKDDAWGNEGGRLYMTSLSLLTLEVYYRHLPLYQRELGGAKQ